MASFMEDLWSSIFTPGPTPTLLIATNVTFAALQLIFLALLLATYSLHFVALSIISAGLWWSINWFAAEVQLAQQAQEAEKEKQEESDNAKTRRKSPVRESADSDTETEALVAKKIDKSTAVTTGSATSGLLPTARDQKKRPSTGGEGSGYGSTDSEWEKVDDTQS
ncbi:Endoplasmic reticulum protein Pkr1 [Penicillium concentricum]|uniref:Endoplasmic reticulum protein Pkr1 n=1 Tax=Penicillium concentricum TaxID=293559 RepID=A0A9W9SBE1_9EURO|nr:Endoplasmic reticulum protein Pkr1 [Penicillium concentricum]KAJ5375290.1 Endoplasmic reticulum protein Pkr1 [Penicillium concentricum]